MQEGYWQAWFKAAGLRAMKTAAQTAITLIGTDAVKFTTLDWMQIISLSGITAVLSMLTSVAGLPEVPVPVEEGKNG